jgi:hypothetical protein
MVYVWGYFVDSKRYPSSNALQEEVGHQDIINRYALHFFFLKLTSRSSLAQVLAPLAVFNSMAREPSRSIDEEIGP